MSSWDPHPRTAPGHSVPSRSNKHWVYPISGDLQLVLYAKGGDRLESQQTAALQQWTEAYKPVSPTA